MSTRKTILLIVFILSFYLEAVSQCRIYQKTGVYYTGNPEGGKELGFIAKDRVYKKTSDYHRGNPEGAKELGFYSNNHVYQKTSDYHIGNPEGAKEIGILGQAGSDGVKGAAAQLLLFAD